ncbi:MAG: PKD domain-containing protein [Bacteroidia bacterium]
MASAHGNEEKNSLEFKENKGQWDSRVLYKADIQGGSLFLEEKGFSYTLFNSQQLFDVHELEHDKGPEVANRAKINFHGLRVEFLNAKLSKPLGEQLFDGYSNYFIGNKSEKWTSFVNGYRRIRYTSLYPDINMEVYSDHGSPKYDFIVQPHGDYRQVVMKYSGADHMLIDADGALVINTSVGIFSELKPYAYQMFLGKKKEVQCNFILKGSEVSFKVGNYDASLPLIIDPVVVASTYSGSTSTTYGHTAAYDDLGNILTGGRSFGTGYPITPGAFDGTFGGNVDIAITKLNPTGSSRIYSTYLGGNDQEYVHSMFSLANFDLLVYGSCFSTDYPTSAGCYDNTHNGGSDIVVTRLNSTGSALLGSTFIGGTANDGQNNIPYNYGDTFRGEIIADAAGTIYLASFTSSNNFPATAGALDATYNGGQDGVIIKLNASFASLGWATYVGGSADDAALGLKLDFSGFGLYISGATASLNFPVLPGAIHPTFLGGGMDGWVMYLASTGNFALASSYIGTAGYDQAYFLQLDASNNVYLYGITEGNLPITPGCYGVASGNIFIMKFLYDFSSVIFQTCLGAASAANFSPTAFLVDNCNKVYISGFGSVSGYAITPNAIPSIGAFYVAVINQDATALVFATYYGAGGDHVDGGTSRFDSRGVIYQGVCTGSNTFPTLPGSVATTKGAGAGWDIAVFKIDMQFVDITANGTVSPSNTGCAPFTANFTNTSVSGSVQMIYSWNYDDGSLLDSTKNPSHVFTAPGVYDVCCVVFDSLTCNLRDTVCIQITVTSGPADPFPADTVLCPGGLIVLDALNPGATYAWNTGAATQSINVNAAGLYYVDISYPGCNRRDSILVNTLSSISIGPDLTVCDTSTILLNPGVSGATYLWSTAAITQTISVTTSGTYWVQVSSGSCLLRDTMLATVDALPQINLGTDTTLCPTQTILLDASSNGATYLWSDGTTAQTLNATQSGVYWVQASNGLCIDRDSIDVNFSIPLSSSADTTLCSGQNFTIQSNGVGVLTWSDGSSGTSLSVNANGIYWVQSNDNGCIQRDTTIVTFAALPSINFGADDVLCPGDSIILNAFNTGASYVWNTGASTSAITVFAPGNFIVTASIGSCSSGDTINITSEPTLILQADTSLCENESVTLSTNLVGNYTWSQGSTTSSILVSQTGQYVLTLSTANCIQKDTVNVTVQALPVVNFGGDDVLCPGDSVVLNAFNAGAAYTWNTGSTASSITVSGAGNYIVVAAIGLCSATDTINITFEPKLILPADTLLCENESISLSTNLVGNYSWSQGSTTSSILVNQTGQYILTLTTPNCIQKDTVNVTVQALPIVNFGGDKVLCPGDSIILNAYNSGSSYTWSTGSTDSAITVFNSGNYFVTAAIGLCSAADTINITFEPKLVLQDDTLLCENESISLSTNLVGNYAWSQGSTTSSILVNQTGQYVLTLSTINCVQKDTVNVTVQALPVVDFGGDTTLCPNANLLLDATNLNANYSWQDGSTNSQFLVNAAGTYFVNVSIDRCTSGDTIEVDYVPTLVGLTDEQICSPQTTLLTATIPGTYLWSNGSNAASIQVSQTGTYSLIVNSSGCLQYDTVDVDVRLAPEVDLGLDTVLCEGESIVLDAANAGATYDWSEGSSSQQINVSSTNNYFVLVDDGFCIGNDTILVTVADFENLQSVVSICEKFEVTLEAQKAGNLFLWSTGATTVSIVVKDSGIYWVETKIDRCFVRDTIIVEGTPGFNQIFLPSAFTPTSDRKNDIYYGVGENLVEYKLMIYNRWGQLVFESAAPNVGWDGWFNDKECPAGVYAYKVSYRTPCSKNQIEEKLGTIMLLR